MVLKGHQTTMMFPYMQKYCAGNECTSYEHKTMCTALFSLNSTEKYLPMYTLLWKWRTPEVLAD